MNRRNALLELWRFLFCIAVLGFHFFSKTTLNIFHAGYLGVEFFFIVSGYFIASHYEKHKPEASFTQKAQLIFSYIVSRLKRLYPLYFLALILMLFVKTIFNNYSVSEVFSLLKDCFAEFFLLQWSPLGKEVLISAGWFVPSVFFGGLLFLLLLIFTGRLGGLVISPLISFFIYRYYFHLIGKIDVIYAHHSVIRGIAGIGLGVFLYFICRPLSSRIKEKKAASLVPTLFFAMANLIFVFTFIYTNLGRRSKLDFLIIFLYAIALLLFMCTSQNISDNMPAKLKTVFLTLGKATYPIYVLQMPLIESIFCLIA